jgi:hypothetical protein
LIIFAITFVTLLVLALVFFVGLCVGINEVRKEAIKHKLAYWETVPTWDTCGIVHVEKFRWITEVEQKHDESE